MTWLTILQTALRTVWANWTVRFDLPTGSNQILTPGYRVVFPSLEDITNPTWARDEWKGPPYDWQNSRSVNRYFLFGNSADGLWTGFPGGARGQQYVTELKDIRKTLIAASAAART
jgi:hypothetical protein